MAPATPYPVVDAIALGTAEAHGREAAKQMGWQWGIERGLAGGAAYHAMLAAHHAFRAVPGLREDSK